MAEAMLQLLDGSDRTQDSPLVGGDDAHLAIKLKQYERYTPTLYKSLKLTAQQQQVLVEGLTAQLQLHKLLQDPTKGVLSAIQQDAQQSYATKGVFDKKTPLQHLESHLKRDPYGSAGIDPRATSMWTETFNKKVKAFDQAYKKVMTQRKAAKDARVAKTNAAKEKGQQTPIFKKLLKLPPALDYFNVKDSAMWSQLQTHMRALQNDTYLRTLAYLPRMMGTETKRKYHAIVKQWYQDHKCHGAARVERETRIPIRVCVLYMHRLCVPTTQADMQQLLQIERTDKSHRTVREWFTTVESTHRQVVSLGTNPEYIVTVNTEATKAFVSQLTK